LNDSRCASQQFWVLDFRFGSKADIAHPFGCGGNYCNL
jgi:hypothetical protein